MKSRLWVSSDFNPNRNNGFGSVTGPWRNTEWILILWLSDTVRFGCKPRSEPSTRLNWLYIMNVHILSSVTCSDNFLVRPNPNSKKAFLIHSFNHQLKTINLFVSSSCSIWEFEESVTCLFFFFCTSSFSGFLKKLTIDLKSTLNFLYLHVLRFIFSLIHIIFVFLCFVFFIVLCKLLFYSSLTLLYVYRWNTKKLLCYE